MKKFMSGLSRSASQKVSGNDVPPSGDSPEAVCVREVTAFCESGGPSGTAEDAGNEYLHLPAIVESAESSPAAAKAAANKIRKCISKENGSRAYMQYNAIMLTRILTDNPGKTFTRNFDTRFVITVKELLRDGHDMSVQQILRETLDSFETDKSADETLEPLLDMWKKEKAKVDKSLQPTNGAIPRTLNAPPFIQSQQQQQNYFARNHRAHRSLPPPEELVARIEEAKTTAKLLSQTVQSTPTSEILNNDLIKEFAERCQSAARSIQGYINSENPPPDEDTLLTLIETNDLLSMAMSKHQRAILSARRAMGSSVPTLSHSPPVAGQGPYAPPPPRPDEAAGGYFGDSNTPPPNPPPRSPQRLSYPPPGSDQEQRNQHYHPPGPPPPRQQQGYSLFDRTSSPPKQSTIDRKPSPLYQNGTSQSRPMPQQSQPPPPPQADYHEDYSTNSTQSSTQSYMRRQDSAEQHFSAHGAPAPLTSHARPAELEDSPQQQWERSPSFAPSQTQSQGRAVSPLSEQGEFEGVRRGMGEMGLEERR